MHSCPACQSLTPSLLSRPPASGKTAKNSLSQIANVSGSSFQYNATAANAAFAQVSNQSSAYNAQGEALNFNSSSAAYSSLQDIAHDQSLQMYYLGIVAAVLTVGVFIFTLVLIPRLKIAIATIKVACETLKDVPFLVLYPIFSSAWTVLFLVRKSAKSSPPGLAGGNSGTHHGTRTTLG